VKLVAGVTFLPRGFYCYKNILTAAYCVVHSRWRWWREQGRKWRRDQG